MRITMFKLASLTAISVNAATVPSNQARLLVVAIKEYGFVADCITTVNPWITHGH